MRKFLINFSPLIIYFLYTLFSLYLRFNYGAEVLIPFYAYAPSSASLEFFMILYYLWKSPIGKTHTQSLFILLILRFILNYVLNYLDLTFGALFIVPFDILILYFYSKRTQDKNRKSKIDYLKLILLSVLVLFWLYRRYLNIAIQGEINLDLEVNDLYSRQYYVYSAEQIVSIIFLLFHLIAVYRYKGAANVRVENMIDEIGRGG